MKKMFLLTIMFLNIGVLTFAIEEEKPDDTIIMQEINRTLVRELTSFYGGYDLIYSDGIKEDNIYFLINEIKYGDQLRKKYDYSKLKDGETVKLNLDQGIELSNISKINKLKVVGKTNKNALVNYEKIDENLIIFFSSIGEYQVTFTDRNSKTRMITFIKTEKYTPKLENIEGNIRNSYEAKNNRFLNENMQVLKSFFPDSEITEEGLFYSLELNEKNKNYEEVRVIAKTLVSHYKLEDDKRIEVITAYLEALKNLGDTDKYLSFLEKITIYYKSSRYYKSYKEEFIEAALEHKYYSSTSLKIALEMSLDSSNLVAHEYLGDYYSSKENYDKAIPYYENSKKIGKIAVIYLETNNIKKHQELKENASKAQLEEINKIEKEYKKKKELERYMGTAEKYVIEDRLQEAELYYKKLLKEDISLDMRSNVKYKLIDLYYNLNEYHTASAILKDVDVNVLNEIYLGNYYYLGGMINYNLQKYEESIEYFNKLIEEFPDSSESNRGKIYIIKINKLNKK
ncbi:MAG: tetratricopeptide repeat protein [Psychrilyobacter sp.]|nr:tetratricopeptide repeat protein [Psychrilyobacter sp.]